MNGQTNSLKLSQSKSNKESLQKTRESVASPFTTKPLIKRKKTGHRLVKRISQSLVESWYPETVVSYEAMDKRLLTKFERYDRKTRLAYLGRPATRQVEYIDQRIRYRKTGTMTFKDHTFTHRLPAKKGYLELLGLATLFKDEKGKAWFRLHHEIQTELVPPTPPLESNKECVGDPKIISLSLNRNFGDTGKQPCLTAGLNASNVGRVKREKRESILRERENRSGESILSPEELSILKASTKEDSAK